MDVSINWVAVNEEDDEMDDSGVLYAYLHGDTGELLYVGKSDSSTVRERLYGEHKDEMFEWLDDNYDMESFGLLVGYLDLPSGRRQTSQLLGEVESLLIYCLQPPANVANKQSHSARQDLVVHCIGDWQQNESDFEVQE